MVRYWMDLEDFILTERSQTPKPWNMCVQLDAVFKMGKYTEIDLVCFVFLLTKVVATRGGECRGLGLECPPPACVYQLLG